MIDVAGDGDPGSSRQRERQLYVCLSASLSPGHTNGSVVTHVHVTSTVAQPVVGQQYHWLHSLCVSPDYYTIIRYNCLYHTILVDEHSVVARVVLVYY